MKKIRSKLKALDLIYNCDFSSAIPQSKNYILIASRFSLKLRDDYEVMFNCIIKEPYSIIFASNRLKNNKDIGILCVMQCARTYDFLGKTIKSNMCVLDLGLKTYPYALKKASKKLKLNKKYSHLNKYF